MDELDENFPQPVTILFCIATGLELGVNLQLWPNSETGCLRSPILNPTLKPLERGLNRNKSDRYRLKATDPSPQELASG